MYRKEKDDKTGGFTLKVRKKFHIGTKIFHLIDFIIYIYIYI